MKKFVGVDLAAEARSTGLAQLHEVGDKCVVESVYVGADDTTIIEAIAHAARAGVDVPLGWPDQFLDFVNAHSAGVLHAPQATDRAWRRSLALRATDLSVQERTGVWPLSVATERIAYAAMRWAGIEATAREQGISMTRDGSGIVCEVYPAAALKCWSLPHRGYKGTKNTSSRSDVVEALSVTIPHLDWNGHNQQCTDDDDALDAVLAALIAYEAFHGRCQPPPEEMRALAKREGWIWLPQL